ncbi:hypothetical protein JX266_014141 [Neoarthrinium moseri]|nr:hypothetical protein JX266_014141 [Neoarthrinium moseri]
MNFLQSTLPTSILAFLRKYIPRCLPSAFVVKILDLKTTSETRWYHQLRDLQGQYIPMFYAEGYLDGHKAIVIQYIDDGIPLNTVPLEDLRSPNIRRGLETVYEQMTERGVYRGDAKLRNFLWLEKSGRVMAIDFSLSAPLGHDSAVNNGTDLLTLDDEISDRLSG